MARRRKLVVAAAVGLGVILAGMGDAWAVSGVALSNNTSVRLDAGIVVDWEVDLAEGGADHLNSMSFWYQINGGAVEKISSSNPNLALDPWRSRVISLPSGYAMAGAVYKGDTLNFTLSYGVTGMEKGTYGSSITPRLQVTNKSDAPIDLRIYKFVDLDMVGSADGDIAVFTADEVITKQGNDVVVATIVAPPASGGLIGQAADVLAAIAGGDNLPSAYIGTSAENGDVAWALQWDAILGPIGQGANSLLISEEMNLTHVPEPVTMVGVGLCVVGLGGYLRRRRTA